MSAGYNKDIETGNKGEKIAARHSDVQLSFNKDGQRKGRTQCERGLFFLVVLCLLAVIGLIIAVVIIKNDSEDAIPADGTTPTPDEDTTPYTSKKCETQGCVHASARVMKNLDMSVDPCEDFYMYSCGSWKKAHLIPEDTSSYGVISQVVERVDVISKNLLENTASYPNVPAIRKARDMYTSCIDLPKIEEKGSSVAIPLLDSLGGWPVLGSNPGGNWSASNFNLSQLLISLRQYNNKPVFNLYIYSDVKDTERYIIYMDQPKFGLIPGRLYYLVDDFRFLREAYVTLAASVAMLFGADEVVAYKEMREVLALEIDIAKIMMRAEDRRDHEALYNKMTISELKQNFTEPGPTEEIQFDWLEYISGVFDLENVKISVNENEHVVVEDIPYFEKVFSVLQKHGKRVVSNYLVWYIMQNRISNLDNRFRYLRTNFYKAIYGVSTSVIRWRECLAHTKLHFGMALGHMFIKQTFDESAKTAVHAMIGNLRTSFDELLNELKWMDEPTKALAKEKADAIKEFIGYPGDAMVVEKVNELYESATVDKNGYFENVLNNLKRYASDRLKKLRQKFDKNVWSDPPSTVNAFYDPILNAIKFPAGILQEPFYYKDQPNSMNYGGIGMIIGHEITHGFDDQGRQLDKDGNLEQWWNTSIITNFKEEAQCFIDQYGQFFVPEANLTINGINTQGENIADNGGLKQSFRAYRKWVEVDQQGIEEPMLPGLNLSHNQLFFLNFAQIWCYNTRKEGLINAITNGVHSPNRYRVNGAIQNSREFSDVFSCKKNSKMNPEQKCSVW